MKRTLAQLAAGEHTTIVAFGDSITHTTFHTQGRMNWVQLLEEALFETYGNNVARVINAGECGGSVKSGLERLDRDVMRFEPDLVIIAFGMNDAGGGEAGLDAFRQNLRQMVRTLREECGSEILLRTPNPVVTVHGIPLPADATGPGKPWLNRRTDLYAAAIVEEAKDLKCACVDHHTAWCEQTFVVPHPVADPTGLWMRMGDAIHPGASGHLAFFRELAPSFKVPRFFPWEAAGIAP